MSSNRDLILKAYKTTLEKILEANGFENDVKEVARKMLFHDAVSSFPVLMVLGGDEIFEDIMGGKVLSFFQVKIRGYSKDEQAPEEALNDLIKDTLKILDDPVYNVYHSKYRPISLSTDEGWISTESNGMAMFELTIEHKYTFERGEP